MSLPRCAESIPRHAVRSIPFINLMIRRAAGLFDILRPLVTYYTTVIYCSGISWQNSSCHNHPRNPEKENFGCYKIIRRIVICEICIGRFVRKPGFGRSNTDIGQSQEENQVSSHHRLNQIFRLYEDQSAGQRRKPFNVDSTIHSIGR